MEEIAIKNEHLFVFFFPRTKIKYIANKINRPESGLWNERSLAHIEAAKQLNDCNRNKITCKNESIVAGMPLRWHKLHNI